MIAKHEQGDLVWLLCLFSKTPTFTSIRFFRNVAFLGSEIFRCSFVGKDLLGEMLAADVAGFQRVNYVKHLETTHAPDIGLWGTTNRDSGLSG